jgi:hypothetical protein
MLYVPQRRIIGGRFPQGSATSEIESSEIESQELLYHSWPTPKSLNCVPFLRHPSKKDRAIIGSGDL